MFDYSAGVLISLLLWLCSAVTLIVALNSQRERNINKIGLRTSWLSHKVTQMEKGDQDRSLLSKTFKFTLLSGLSIPLVLLSWVCVALVIIQVAYNLSKDFGAPQSIREFRWKLKNIDMSFDQVAEEFAKLDSRYDGDFDTARAAIIDDMTERGLRINYN